MMRLEKFLKWGAKRNVIKDESRIFNQAAAVGWVMPTSFSKDE